MNDATVRFGYDGAALNAGLAQSEQRLKRFGSTAESQFRRTTAASEQMGRAMNKRPGMNGLGNVSMQLQDVAVQMQSGTKASIIFAQQGSQMLSAFGPMGMIAGLAAAVGGAVYLMGQKSEESFKLITEGAIKSREQIKLTLAETTADNLASSAAGIRDKFDAVGAELEKLQSFSGSFGAAVDEAFGGVSIEKKIDSLSKLQEEYNAAYKASIQAALEDGKKQIEIAEKRLHGEASIADQLELEVKHSRELARINALRIPESDKRGMRSLADDRAQIAAEKLAKAAADLAENQKKELDQRKASIAASREDLGLLELQASGRDRLVKKAERELQQRRRMQELIGTGMDPRSAEDYVRRETSARDAIEKRRSNGGRGTIGGVRERRFMESGIDRFNRDQERRKTEYGINERTPPGLPSKLVGPDGHFYSGGGAAFGSLADRRPNAGRMMGGMTQPLMSRPRGNPEISRITSPPSDAGRKLDNIASILTRGLL